MTVLISRDERRKFFPLFLLWGTAIAISTLTTKQHYLIDIIAGLALGVFSWVIFHRCIKYRPLNRDQ
jgi:membrane-associated phospholipid phosphatase